MNIVANKEEQTLDILEDGSVLAKLSFAEATRWGLRCVVEHLDVRDDSGEVISQEVIMTVPDLSAVRVERGMMTVSLRTGEPLELPCLTVFRGQTKVGDVMLPYDEG